MDVQYLPVIFANAKDCTGKITAGGSHQPSNNTTVTWSGGTTLRSVDAIANPGGVLYDLLIWNRVVLQVSAGTALSFRPSASGSFTSTTRVVDQQGRVTETIEGVGFDMDSFPFLLKKPISFKCCHLAAQWRQSQFSSGLGYRDAYLAGHHPGLRSER